MAIGILSQDEYFLEGPNIKTVFLERALMVFTIFDFLIVEQILNKVSACFTVQLNHLLTVKILPVTLLFRLSDSRL